MTERIFPGARHPSVLIRQEVRMCAVLTRLPSHSYTNSHASIAATNAASSPSGGMGGLLYVQCPSVPSYDAYALETPPLDWVDLAL
jgi:hypothetical protein